MKKVLGFFLIIGGLGVAVIGFLFLTGYTLVRSIPSDKKPDSTDKSSVRENGQAHPDAFKKERKIGIPV